MFKNKYRFEIIQNIFFVQDKNQEVEIKLEGKNVSPAPERRKQ